MANDSRIPGYSGHPIARRPTKVPNLPKSQGVERLLDRSRMLQEDSLSSNEEIKAKLLSEFWPMRAYGDSRHPIARRPTKVPSLPKSQGVERLLDRSHMLQEDSLSSNEEIKTEHLSLDKEIKVKLLSEFGQMRAYGERLKTCSNNAARDKGEKILTIVTQLTKQLSKGFSLTGAEKEEFWQRLLDTLHQHDSSFAVHRSYKRCIRNAILLLCTVGLFHLVKRAMTGQWLFFNKTTTEEKVDHVHIAIEIAIQH